MTGDFLGFGTEAQIQFLGDSLEAQGKVTPRRSCEICASERNKVKHVIVRKEYYIECSCGYKGPALEALAEAAACLLYTSDAADE